MAARAPAQPAWHEADRLAALQEYRILDTAPEAAFSGIVRLAAHVCNTPIALVSFVARTRQWFKAEVGLGTSETPIEQSVCAHAIRQNGLFMVPDATQDQRFAHNPLVTGEPFIRFYAGAPLMTPRGLPLGTLCVIDSQPRPEGLTAEQGEMLLTLARQVVTQLEHRLALVRLGEQQAEVAEGERRFQAVTDLVPDLLWSTDPDGRAMWHNRRWLEHTGQTSEQASSYGWLDAVHPGSRDALLDTLRSTYHGERTPPKECSISDAEGVFRCFLLRAEPLRDDRGGIQQWFIAATDIHDLRQVEQNRALLLAEPQHRVSSTLALIRTIARRVARSAGTVEDYAAHLEGRMDALARAQEVSARGAAGGVDLASLVAEELISFAAHEGEQVTLTGPSLRLAPKAAERLALAIHELATNALEHGALTSPEGQIAVTWAMVDGEAGPGLALEWVESGVLLDEAAPRRAEFGTEVLERTLACELQARTGLTLGPEGVRCTIELPLSE